MCKINGLSFDQFMLSFVNNKKDYDFKLMGLTLSFKHKDNIPVLILDDDSVKKEYQFNSDFDICRLTFNGIPISVIFDRFVLL